MKAWRFYAFGDMRLDEVPDPEVKPGWAVCKVRRVQPSITDVQRSLGIGTINSALLREMLEKYAPVQLLGHEMSAEVVEVGEGVEHSNSGRQGMHFGPRAVSRLQFLPRGPGDVLHRQAARGHQHAGRVRRVHLASCARARQAAADIGRFFHRLSAAAFLHCRRHARREGSAGRDGGHHRPGGHGTLRFTGRAYLRGRAPSTSAT